MNNSSKNLNQTFLEPELQEMAAKQERSTRIKERMIEDAVMLVLHWRQLSEKSEGKKLTLKQGANIIGVAKKSLDDYLLQLRLGRKYGFDFKKNGNMKIGILRTFNRNMKKKFKEGKFLAGRKRKEEEEDYTEMVRKIIIDIHGSSNLVHDLSPSPSDKIRELLISPTKESLWEPIPDSVKYGIRPVKKLSSTTLNTNNSEKDSEIGNCSEDIGPVHFSFQNNWNAECNLPKQNSSLFIEEDYSFPEFQNPFRQADFIDIWEFSEKPM